MSLISVILASESVGEPLSEEQHKLAMEYFGLQLSMRDREELNNIFCKGHPDHLTQSIRECVSAYDPIIRSVHNAYDLGTGLLDFENFLTDFIKVSKRRKEDKNESENEEGTSEGPTVDDYVALLRKHLSSAHRFLHQVAKNGPDVTSMYRTYLEEAVAEFKVENISGKPKNDMSLSANGAGTMTEALNSIFEKLSAQDRESVIEALDKYSDYLSTLAASSQARMKAILSDSHNTIYGPGMYLAKWQSLLDSTLITPATPNGPLRYGNSPDVREASQIDMSDRTLVGGDGHEAASKLEGREQIPPAPNVDAVVELLQPKFREMLAKRVQ
jgi:hypothetical protein